MSHGGSSDSCCMSSVLRVRPEGHVVRHMAVVVTVAV